MLWLHKSIGANKLASIVTPMTTTRAAFRAKQSAVETFVFGWVVAGVSGLVSTKFEYIGTTDRAEDV